MTVRSRSPLPLPLVCLINSGTCGSRGFTSKAPPAQQRYERQPSSPAFFYSSLLFFFFFFPDVHFLTPSFECQRLPVSPCSFLRRGGFSFLPASMKFLIRNFTLHRLSPSTCSLALLLGSLDCETSSPCSMRRWRTSQSPSKSSISNV